MKDRKDTPILFSAPMVRAILAGTKTQTRRPLYVVRKSTPNVCFDPRYPPPLLDWARPQHGPGECFTLSNWRHAKAGHRLWVREAWRALGAYDNQPPRNILPGNVFHFEADWRCGATAGPNCWGKLRQGRFMCRWASRITLEITGVRVERLQEISTVDAFAEGAPVVGLSARQDYREIWESINGAGSWEANPFVWVLEFRRA